MIIDSHVHISLYNSNAKNLKEAFTLFLEEMERNDLSAAIIIPDNIENSEGIADLERAAELIGDRRNLFLLGSPQIIQRGSGELNKYKELLDKGKIRGIKFFPAMILITRSTIDVCRITNFVKKWVFQFCSIREKIRVTVNAPSGMIRNILFKWLKNIRI
jgi:hypothetical protein